MTKNSTLTVSTAEAMSGKTVNFSTTMLANVWSAKRGTYPETHSYMYTKGIVIHVIAQETDLISSVFLAPILIEILVSQMASSNFWAQYPIATSSHQAFF